MVFNDEPRIDGERGKKYRRGIEENGCNWNEKVWKKVNMDDNNAYMLPYGMRTEILIELLKKYQE